MKSLLRTCLLACVGVAAASGLARAALVEDVFVGLGYLGFNAEGQYNPLSDGADLIINNNFNGRALDFGVGELALTGPISLQASVGRRFVNTLDVSFSTALAGDIPASPLNYAFNTDVGGQRTNIDGSLFIDGDLSINGFGFYDLDFTYSSRQSVARDGRFSNSADNYDFDLGPVSVRGNIFADVLALVTDPLFTAAGADNIFEQFSASAQLKQILDAAAFDGLAGPFADDTALNARLVGPFFDPAPTSVVQPVGAVVPEPLAWLLLAAGIPALILQVRARTRRLRA